MVKNRDRDAALTLSASGGQAKGSPCSLSTGNLNRRYGEKVKTPKYVKVSGAKKKQWGAEIREGKLPKIH